MLRHRLGLNDVISLLACVAMQKEDNDWIKKGLEHEVEGSRPRGRPKKTWREMGGKDCRAHKLNKKDATDCKRWRKQITDD